VDQVRDRIEKELESVMDRLRQLGGGVVIEVYPGALDDNDFLFADLMEEVQVQQEREMGLRLLPGPPGAVGATTRQGRRGCSEGREEKKSSSAPTDQRSVCLTDE